METKRVNVVVEQRVWKRFQALLDPTKKQNASYHIREAMKLYLMVLDTEDDKIFEENRDQELDREDTC